MTARKQNRLNADRLSRKSGMYADGNGLWFAVTSSNSRSWVYRYSLNGKPREMGLGPYPAIPLPKARAKAAEARALKARGIDPLDEKSRLRVQAAFS